MKKKYFFGTLTSIMISGKNGNEAINQAKYPKETKDTNEKLRVIGQSYNEVQNSKQKPVDIPTDGGRAEHTNFFYKNINTGGQRYLTFSSYDNHIIHHDSVLPSLRDGSAVDNHDLNSDSTDSRQLFDSSQD